MKKLILLSLVSLSLVSCKSYTNFNGEQYGNIPMTDTVNVVVGYDYMFESEYEIMSKWSEEEKENLKERLKLSTEIIKSFALSGLNNTMNTYNGKSMSRSEVAEAACHLEIDILKEPIGKQDQYIAAYGGIKKIEFNPDESVSITSLPFSDSEKNNINF